jgi:hypothetical protein
VQIFYESAMEFCDEFVGLRHADFYTEAAEKIFGK